MEDGLFLPLLPPDIITDIFSRLPVKPLLRFKCVSKHFCVLIDSPHFTKKHLEFSISKTNTNLKLIVTSRGCEFGVYFVDYFKPFEKKDIDTKPVVFEQYPPLTENPDDSYAILGSCNGLLRLSTFKERFIFWNPTTRNQWVLPPQPVIPRKKGGFKSSYGYGFGHVSRSNDYKVVIILNCIDCNRGCLFKEVHVYSLTSNSWRRVEGFPNEISIRSMQIDNVLVNECLHWAVVVESNDLYDKILSFEIGSESFQMVPSPEVKITEREMSVQALGGWLCAFYQFADMGLDVWAMKEYGVKESWTKLFTVNHSEIGGLWLPITYSRDDDKVLFQRNSGIKGGLILYDLVRKTVEEVDIEGMPERFVVTACSESLVNPNGDTRNIFLQFF